MVRRGVIFDLDGVLVSTDEMHYRAWKALADEEGIPFTEQDNDRLRGVSRMQSLEVLLERAGREYTAEEKEELATRTNRMYQRMLEELTAADRRPGVDGLLRGLQARGARIAVASGSRNARRILERLRLAGAFDAVVTGEEISRAKPDPELFLLAAERLGLSPRECVVVEDAASGVEAARRAGMHVVAVGPRERFPRGVEVVGSVGELDPDRLLGLARDMAAGRDAPWEGRGGGEGAGPRRSTARDAAKREEEGRV